MIQITSPFKKQLMRIDFKCYFNKEKTIYKGQKYTKWKRCTGKRCKQKERCNSNTNIEQNKI